MNMQFARRMEQFGAGIFNVLDEKRREREAAGIRSPLSWKRRMILRIKPQT